MRYDPERPPKPDVWLDLDENERILAVQRYHRRTHEKAGSPGLHAAFHAVVETQLAEGEPVVEQTLARLMAEGLSRHDAIHAIGSVLAERMYDAVGGEKAPAEGADLMDVFLSGLHTLTAEGWIEKNREGGEG